MAVRVILKESSSNILSYEGISKISWEICLQHRLMQFYNVIYFLAYNPTKMGKALMSCLELHKSYRNLQIAQPQIFQVTKFRKSQYFRKKLRHFTINSHVGLSFTPMTTWEFKRLLKIYKHHFYLVYMARHVKLPAQRLLEGTGFIVRCNRTSKEASKARAVGWKIPAHSPMTKPHRLLTRGNCGRRL